MGGGVEYLTPSDRARQRRQPCRDSEDVFDEATAPGLESQPDFVRAHAFVECGLPPAAQSTPRRAGTGPSCRHYDDRRSAPILFDRFDARRPPVRQRAVGTPGVRRSAPSSRRPTPRTVRRCRSTACRRLGGNDSLRGFPRVPLPRPARAAAAGRVSLGDLERARCRPVLRRRQGGRSTAADLDFDGLRERLRLRVPLQHRQRR